MVRYLSAGRWLCMVGAVANVPNQYGPVDKPGPRPVFTRRMELRLRADQHRALVTIARSIGVSVSDVVRSFVDHGINHMETGEMHGHNQ